MDTNSLFVWLLPFLVAGAATYYLWRRSHSLRVKFPPGPPGLPILGNVFDIAVNEPWIACKRLGEKYGDLIHIRVLTQDTIILNSYEVMKDLFERRSQNYSSRPHLPANNMLGLLTWGTVFLPYGEEWKEHRKMFQQAFRSENIASYQPMQSMKTRELLKNMSDSPADFEQHFRTFSTAITMAATYDYHPTPRDDPMVNNLKELATITVSLAGPEKLVMFTAFPFLMYIPAWFPGATWRRSADAGRKLIDWWLTAPIQYVKEKMADGPIATCIVGEALSRIDEKQAGAGNIIRTIQGVAASSLLAASDTTDSALQVFVLAMVLYPDVQKRAQDEIRAVVGTERLPGFSDRSSLPYIEAVLRETLRWHPILPFSFVRSATNDDVYRGYSFPKGITIIPNVWAIAHDEARYPDSFTFNPSRFFDDGGNLNDDTVSYAFGFGRRICVGRVLADASMWISIANMLAVFSFEAPLDRTGNPVKIAPRFTTGLTSHPERFPVQITRRMEAQKFASLLRGDA